MIGSKGVKLAFPFVALMIMRLVSSDCPKQHTNLQHNVKEKFSNTWKGQND